MLRIGLTQENALELPGWSARLLMLGVHEDEDGLRHARVVSDVAAPDTPYRFEGSSPVGGLMQLLPGRLFRVRDITDQMVFLDELPR